MRIFPVSYRTRTTTLASGLAILASLAAAIHCGSDDEAPITAGKSGSSGTSGAAGSSGSAGASGTQGTSGTTGSGGIGGGDSSVEPQPDSGGTDGNADASDAAPDTFDPTVHGSLKTNSGLPVAGVSVVIGSTVVVSDTNGEFVVANVPSTYDLLILQTPSTGRKFAELYVGLTTRRPAATLIAADVTGRSATVSGTVKPEGGFPQAAFQRTEIAFDSANKNAFGSIGIEGDAGPGFGPLRVSWTGNETIAGQLYALQWSYGSTRIPTAYRAWGTQPFTLANGASPSATVTLGTVAQQETAGTVRFPQQIRSLTAAIAVGQINVLSNNLPLPSGATTAPYRYPVPTGLGDIEKILTFHADVTLPNALSSETRARLKDSTTTLDVEVVSPAAQALPVSGATNVDVNTEFAWSPVPNAVYTLVITSSQTGFAVYTTTTSAKIPDTLTKGIPLAAASYLWQVNARGPARSTDDLMTGKTMLDTSDMAFDTLSTLRTFTAKAP